MVEVKGNVHAVVGTVQVAEDSWEVVIDTAGEKVQGVVVVGIEEVIEMIGGTVAGSADTVSIDCVDDRKVERGFCRDWWLLP